jgi:type VII secretion integral membrane protein EccD
MAMVGALLAYPVGAAGAASIVCVLVAAGIGLAPMLAVRLGRLPLPVVTADPALLAGESHPPRAAVRAAVARADDILAGGLLGLAAVALGCVSVLAPGPGLAARLLALLTAAAVLMRARLFPSVAARLPLLAAGTLGLVYAVVMVASGPTARLVAGGTGVLVVIALLAVATAARRARVTSPYLGRLGDIADVLAVVAMAPLACVVLGLFDWVRTL